MIASRWSSVRVPVALVLIVVLSLAAAAALFAEEDAADEFIPVRTFYQWDRWGAKTDTGIFDMNRCSTLQAGDANGDGLTDLICPYNYGGNQTKTFVQYSTSWSYSGWTVQHSQMLTGFDLGRCRDLLSGDVDGDGRTDLICPYDYGSAQTATFVQLAFDNDTYTSWQLWAAKTATNSFDMNRCTTLQAGDANDDGLTDLICPYNYGGNQTRTFVQYSSGMDFSGWTPQHPNLLTGFDLGRCRPLVSGDANGDGRTDLICPYDYASAQTATFVQLALDNDTYTPWQLWAAQTQTGSFDMNRCTTLQAGDANADGLIDLICPYNYGGNQTRTWIQFSNGTDYSPWTSQHTDLLTGFDLDRCTPLVSGDLDDDGRTDLICPYDYGSASTATFVQMGGLLAYTPWLRATDTLATGLFNMTSCRDLKVGDANGDSHADLICPYDYGSAQTATYVQRAQVYTSYVPGIIR